MKVTPSAALNLILIPVFFFGIILSPVIAFSQTAVKNTTVEQLASIQKRLDESQKREEQILANQEKILAEIITSRKWARNR